MDSVAYAVSAIGPLGIIVLAIAMAVYSAFSRVDLNAAIASASSAHVQAQTSQLSAALVKDVIGAFFFGATPPSTVVPSPSSLLAILKR